MKPNSTHVATILFMVAVLILIYLSNTGQLKQLRGLLAEPASTNSSEGATGAIAGATSGVPSSVTIPGMGSFNVVPNSASNNLPVLPLPQGYGSSPGLNGNVGQLSGDIGSLEQLFG